MSSSKFAILCIVLIVLFPLHECMRLYQFFFVHHVSLSPLQSHRNSLDDCYFLRLILFVSFLFNQLSMDKVLKQAIPLEKLASNSSAIKQTKNFVHVVYPKLELWTGVTREKKIVCVNAANHYKLSREPASKILKSE